MDGRSTGVRLAEKVAIAKSLHTGHVLSDILKTLPAQAVIVLFWALLFSAVFNADIFTQLALEHKSRMIGEKEVRSKQIIVVEFDKETMARQGKQADSIENLFKLVDTMLTATHPDTGESLAPRVILLDYALNRDRDFPVIFKKKYQNKVVWGSSPYQRGLDWDVSGVSPGTFRYVCDGTINPISNDTPDFCANLLELSTISRIKPWGHLRLGVQGGSEDVVSHIQLIESFGLETLTANSYLLSLPLAAFITGEVHSSPGEVINSYISNKKQGSEPCFINFGDTSLDCRSWEMPRLFYTPPLPIYFPRFSALEFLRGKTERQNLGLHNANQLRSFLNIKDKYVVLTSTWNRDEDHYQSHTSTTTGAIRKFTENFDVLSLSQTQGAIPGAYFHATILETLLNPNYPFPSEGTIIEQILFSISIFIVLWTLAWLLKTFLLRWSSHLTRKNKEDFRDLVQKNFWLMFIFFAITGFILFYYQAVYVVTQLNLVVSFMWVYLISICLCSIYVVGGSHDEELN